MKYKQNYDMNPGRNSLGAGDIDARLGCLSTVKARFLLDRHIFVVGAENPVRKRQKIAS